MFPIVYVFYYYKFFLFKSLLGSEADPDICQTAALQKYQATYLPVFSIHLADIIIFQ